MSDRYMRESIPLYDRVQGNNRLVPILENKDAHPLDINMYLTEDPWVSIQGEGQYSGEYFCFIRTSYCPLSCSFCDIKASWTDKNKPMWSISTLVEWAKKKYPHRVCITGGEPLYKYDEEVVHLVEGLHKINKKIHVETSGVCVPNTFINAVKGDTKIPDWVCISPKHRNCVPKEEETSYMQYMLDQMQFWKEAFMSKLIEGEWKFVIGYKNTEEDVIETIWLLEEIYQADELNGTRIILQPETRSDLYSTPFEKRTPEMYIQYLQDWSNLVNITGKLLPNFMGADVHIMSQAHQLTNFR